MKSYKINIFFPLKLYKGKKYNFIFKKKNVKSIQFYIFIHLKNNIYKYKNMFFFLKFFYYYYFLKKYKLYLQIKYKQ